MSPKRLIATLFMTAVLLGMFGFVAMMVTGAGKMVSAFDDIASESSGSVAQTRASMDGKLEAITSSGPLNIVWKKGDKTSYEFSGPENLVKRIKVTFENGNLAFKTTGVSFNGTVTITVVGEQPKTLTMAGSGDATLDDLDGSSLNVTVAGSNEVQLSGKLDNLESTIAGSGKVDASELKTQVAKVSIAGSGDVTVDAIKTLDATIMGSGNVKYKGSPKVKSSIAGSGRIEQED